MKPFLLTVMFLLLWSSYSSAQTYSSSVQTKDLTFPLPKLSRIPELHTDMTLDCFIGYVALDSLMHSNIDLFQALNIPSRLSIQDLRFLGRLIYGIDEYSHTHLSAHLAATRDTGRSIHDNRPFMASFYAPVIKAIGMERWKEFHPHHRALLTIHYIYRVRVVNAAQGIDSSFGSDYGQIMPMTAVSCEVIETVKGTKVPSSCRLYSPAEKDNHSEKTLNNSFPCITFAYNSREIKLLPKIGEEYYVFLWEGAYTETEQILGVISSFGEKTWGLPPLLGGWPGMFRINNGTVEDPKHFWSQNPLTVEQFRALLQSKIAEIKSWKPKS